MWNEEYIEESQTVFCNGYYTESNSNPFHNYENMELTRMIMFEQYENMMSKDFKTFADAPPHKTKCSPHYYMENCCMLVAKDKPNKTESIRTIQDNNGFLNHASSGFERLPLKIENGELWEKSIKDVDHPPKYSKKGILRKRTKQNPVLSDDGYWVYTLYYPNYSPITSDIQTVFEICNDYKYVWCSLDKNQRRDVLVCDVDEEQYDDDKTVEKILAICQKYELPNPTYLEWHVDRKRHYQFGWILRTPILFNKKYNLKGEKEPLDGHQLYLKLLRTTKSLFTMADDNFTGLLIRNPNALKETYTQWFNDTVSTSELIAAFTPYIQKLKKEKKVDRSSTSAIVLDDVISTPDRITREYQIKNSRHIFTRDCVRDWIFDYVHSRNTFPSYEDVLECAYCFEKMGAEKLNKKTIRSSNEIEADARSVLDFCKNNYKSPKEYSSEKRAFSEICRKAYKQISINEAHFLRKNGFTNEMIMNETGKKRTTIKSYLNKECPGINDILCLLNSISSESSVLTKKQKRYIADCEASIKLYNDNFREQTNESLNRNTNCNNYFS